MSGKVLWEMYINIYNIPAYFELSAALRCTAINVKKYAFVRGRIFITRHLRCRPRKLRVIFDIPR